MKIKELFLQFRNMSLQRLGLFAVGGVIFLQCIRYFQYGSLKSPLDQPAPIIVGICFGLFGALASHIAGADKQQLKVELAKKEKLLRSLEQSEERLLLATKRLWIWDWDITNDILYMSPEFAENLGYTAEEFEEAKNGSVTNLMHPDDVDSYRRKLLSQYKNPQPSFMNQHRFRHKSGDYKWFMAFGQFTVDSAGRSVRFNGTLTDISERIELEARLQQSQKLEAIGNLTGGVAHDFNNLLAVILGNFELIQNSDDPEEIRQFASEGIAATRRGAELTKNMLGFARQSSLDPKVIDLNDLIEETKSWVSRAVPENIAFTAMLSTSLSKVRVDPNFAQSAILNLILNARDAMPHGGRLTIETSNTEIGEGHVDLAGETVAAGQYVLLEISDSGAGVDKANLKNIFEPFYTTKPVGEGSGLGLSMVQGFVKQSGGTIHVESKLGLGTTVKLYFRAHSGTVHETPMVRQPFVSKSKKTLKILLVEDNSAVLEVQEKILSRAGFKVDTALSGDKAIAVLENDFIYDLVITDIVMPGDLQGTDLAKRLRSRFPQLPIIFLSGYSEVASNSDTLNRPNIIRLMKPVGKQQLLDAVHQAVSPNK